MAMAEMEKVEFKFPHEREAEAAEDTIEIEIEGEEVKVEVVDDTPEQDRNRKPMTEPPEAVTEEELSRYKDTRLKDRLSHLNKGYHEERRNKEAALRERDEAIFIAQKIIAENEQLKGSVHTNQKVLIEQAKRVVEGKISAAEREYTTAYEAGDSAALLAAQKKLTAASIEAEKVANFKPQPLQTQENAVQPAPTPQPPAREVAVDEKAASWKRSNGWFNQDREMTGFALAVHERLVEEEGIDPRSDAYYARIDARMREKFPEKFADSPSEKPKRSNVVAPATRSAAPKKIVLTPSAVSIAKRLGIPLELYARKVAEEMRNSNG
jgi:hypothetical protein